MLLLLKLPQKIMKYSTKRAYKVIYTEPTLVILLVVSDLWCSLLLQTSLVIVDVGSFMDRVLGLCDGKERDHKVRPRLTAVRDYYRAHF